MSPVGPVGSISWKKPTSWWFQPLWKICSSKWVHLPQIGVKIPKIFELPPPWLPFFFWKFSSRSLDSKEWWPPAGVPLFLGRSLHGCPSSVWRPPKTPSVFFLEPKRKRWHLWNQPSPPQKNRPYFSPNFRRYDYDWMSKDWGRHFCLERFPPNKNFFCLYLSTFLFRTIPPQKKTYHFVENRPQQIPKALIFFVA